jgi:hypothetical protein
MHYVKHFDINGVDTKQVACIELHGKPNAATEGHVGVLGIDVDSPLHDVYKCVAVNGSIYTWELLSSGMSMISATITFGGAETAQFPYINLRTPAMYVVKIGDLIVDKEGYLYQIHSLNSTYCEATYCDTQAFQGAQGDKGDRGETGFGYVAAISRPAFTESQWAQYGEIGHIETWSNSAAAEVRNGCRIGDIFTINGTATDTGNAHIMYYRSNTDSGDLAGTCIAHSIALRGATGPQGPAYTLNDTDKNSIASAVKASLTKEAWTFTLEDGSTVTKGVYVGKAPLPVGTPVTVNVINNSPAGADPACTLIYNGAPKTVIGNGSFEANVGDVLKLSLNAPNGGVATVNGVIVKETSSYSEDPAVNLYEYVIVGNTQLTYKSDNNRKYFDIVEL